MTDTLKRVELTGSDYASCYLELTAQLRAALDVDGYTDAEQAYLREMYDGMELWVKIAQGFLLGISSYSSPA
jgi:hypothetical protein